MSTANTAIARGANFRAAPSGPPGSQGGAIVDALRDVFPEHARKLIATFTGLSPGATKKKLEGDRPFHADELAALLRTDQGFELLSRIMAGSRPRWWVLCSAFMEVRDAQRLQAKARAKIRKALNADADLSAAIARADALSDEDFHRPHVDALRSMGGVSDRAMASATKVTR